MGVDLYLKWDGMDEEAKAAQITGFQKNGSTGYLRGAYFGGYSDVLRYLFDWADWDENTPFDPDKMEARLKILKRDRTRPDKGKWDHTKGADRGWDLSKRQDDRIDDSAIKEYDDFLALGKQWIKEGKKPYVYVSY